MPVRYLNKKYKDIETDARTDRGTTVKLKVDIAPTKANAQDAPVRPPLKWTVTRISLDDKYADDPVLSETVAPAKRLGRAVERHVLTLVVPDVTAARYSVSATLGQKVVKTFDEIVAWRRIYANVEADTAYAYNVYKRSLAKVVEWFQRANILFVPNLVTVAKRPTAKKDKSENGVRGDAIALALKEAKWDEVDVDLALPFKAGALPPTSESTKLVGTELQILLKDHCKWAEAPNLLRGVTMEKEKKALLNLQYYRRDEGDPAKLAAIVTRASDQLVKIDLTSDHLKPLLAAVQGKEDFDLALALRFDQFGRELGGQIGHEKRASFYFYTEEACTQFKHAQTDKMVAALVCHEIGHILRLARSTIDETYADALRVFELQSGTPYVPRVKAPASAANPLHHDGARGGSGQHCSFGCRDIQCATTTSGRTYQPDLPTHKTCIMYHSAPTDVRDEGFCDTCLQALRRGG